MVGEVPDLNTSAKFQIKIFVGYDFTGGRMFDFPIDNNGAVLMRCLWANKVSNQVKGQRKLCARIIL